MSAILQIFASRRMLLMLMMGFASGLPLALTASTLQAWMTGEGIDIKVIGLFSLAGLPYSLKFLWAPLLDRYSLPFLGRRQGWMLLIQLCLIATICTISLFDPAAALSTMALLIVILAFFSASQDIILDAYRTELLTEVERGAGSAIYIMGYRLAMLTSGALALILADQMPWSSVYQIMAAAMLVGVGATIMAPATEQEYSRPRTLTEAVVNPFVEFLKRDGAALLIAFVILYKLGDVLALALNTPFLLQLGFAKTEIGVVSKTFGLIATIAGALFGGALMIKLGLRRSLWLFGILQGVSILCFALLAVIGRNTAMMTVAVAVENLCSGMGNAAFTAFLMSLCNKRYTATQYALLTSLMALSRQLAGAPTGAMAAWTGWPLYFCLCTVAAIPGLILLSKISRFIDEKREP